MNKRTPTFCKHCDNDLPWERISAGTTICARCEKSHREHSDFPGNGPPNGSAYMLAQETIARLKAEIDGACAHVASLCAQRSDLCAALVQMTEQRDAAVKDRDEAMDALVSVSKSFENYQLSTKPKEEWDDHDAMMAPAWAKVRAVLAARAAAGLGGSDG